MEEYFRQFQCAGVILCNAGNTGTYLYFMKYASLIDFVVRFSVISVFIKTIPTSIYLTFGIKLQFHLLLSEFLAIVHQSPTFLFLFLFYFYFIKRVWRGAAVRSARHRLKR